MENGGGQIVINRTVEELVAEISSLPSDERAEIVAKVLGDRPGLNVIFGNGSNGNHVEKADLVIQINNADKDVIEGITSVIARRIER